MVDKLPIDIAGWKLYEAANWLTTNGYRFRVIAWENADAVIVDLDNPARRAGYDAKNVNLHIKCGLVIHYSIG